MKTLHPTPSPSPKERGGRAPGYTYTYDPQANSLTFYEGGKARGGFKGRIAERKLAELILNEADIIITDMDTKNSRSLKIRRLRALWINQGIDKHRDAILEPYGVSSTADLSEAQLEELLADYSHKNHKPVDERTRIMRSEVLTILNKLGIYQTNGDWAKVNEYLLDKRIAGKVLYQLNMNELPNLIRKLRSILDKQTPPQPLPKGEGLKRGDGGVKLNNQEN